MEDLNVSSGLQILASETDLSSNDIPKETLKNTFKQFPHSGKKFCNEKSIDISKGIKSLFGATINSFDFEANIDYIYLKNKNKYDIFFSDSAFKKVKFLFTFDPRNKQKNEKTEAESKEEKTSTAFLDPKDLLGYIPMSNAIIPNEVLEVKEIGDFIEGKTSIDLEESKTKILASNFATKEDVEALSTELRDLKEALKNFNASNDNFKETTNIRVKLLHEKSKFIDELKKEVRSVVEKYEYAAKQYDDLAKIEKQMDAAIKLHKQDSKVAKHEGKYFLSLIENQSEMLVNVAKVMNTLLDPNANYALTLQDCINRAKAENILYLYPNYYTVNGYLKEKGLDGHVIWKYGLSKLTAEERKIYKSDKDPELPYRRRLATLCRQISDDHNIPQKSTLIFVNNSSKQEWDDQKTYHKDAFDKAIVILYKEFPELSSDKPNYRLRIPELAEYAQTTSRDNESKNSENKNQVQLSLLDYKENTN